jgi:hypothetical protein
MSSRTRPDFRSIPLLFRSNLAAVLVNASLDECSPAVGAAQRLSRGNFLIGTGWVLDETTPSGFSTDAFEVSPGGDSIYIQRFPTQSYRTFLLRDMYNPD